MTTVPRRGDRREVAHGRIGDVPLTGHLVYGTAAQLRQSAAEMEEREAAAHQQAIAKLNEAMERHGLRPAS